MLADSHILLWTLAGDDRLSLKGKSIMLAPENEVYFSVVSIWEIAVKHAAHPQHVKFSGRDLAWHCRRADFTQLDLRLAHINALETLVRPADAPTICRPKSPRFKTPFMPKTGSSRHPRLSCPTIGICFPFQKVEKIPVEPWDIPVQRVL